MKDIKVKETKLDINSLDKNKTLQHFTKQKDVKEKSNQSQQESADISDPSKKATNTVVGREKKTAVESVYMAKQYAKKIKRKQADIKDKRSIDESSKSGADIKEKQADIKDKKSNDSHLIKTKEKDAAANRTTSRLKSDAKKTSSIQSDKQPDRKIKTKSVNGSKQVKFRPVNKNDYQSKMHFFHIHKHKQKVKEAQQNSSRIKKGIGHLGNGIKNTFKVVRVAVTSVQNILSIGGTFILLVVLALFFGVFSALADDSSVNSAMQSVSPEVLAYSDTVSKYAKEYDIEDYVGVINAVMMQESAGKGNDPMQSSECEYNTKYPKEPNGITDPKYSIKAGVHYLSDTIKLAKVKDPSDIKHLSLALQAYNFGKGYIDWANINFGGYTRANAKVYSDQKKAELKTDVYGDPQYVPHVMQYYHIGNNNVVQIAQSQIGNIGGRPYWSWYGFNSRVEWCACFVSWVMNEAGLIEDGTVPKFAYCPTGIQWFKQHDQWQGRQYAPAPGDIIFFDWQNDNISDHVGIVEKVENGTVYTIEGNSINDECRQNSYPIGSIYIAGYGIIKNE